MQATTFWKTIVMDHSELLEGLINLLAENKIRYCVIGGQGVNAYVTPLVSLDLDLVVAVDQIERLAVLLSDMFIVRHFPHSINISAVDSDLRVQIQTDVRYFDFVDRSSTQEILGLSLPVASVEDLLQGKIWAALDDKRRASKRQKDLTDIARLLEEFPHLRDDTPQEILDRLFL